MLSVTTWRETVLPFQPGEKIATANNALMAMRAMVNEARWFMVGHELTSTTARSGQRPGLQKNVTFVSGEWAHVSRTAVE
jgi:hypothetical protein